MRVLFNKGEQKKFINKILSKISIREAAKLCNLSERTIRDWRREKFLIESGALRKLCGKTGIRFPSNIKTKKDYWYVGYGSSIGGSVVWKKYGRIGGNPEYRKKKWHEWWEREGKYKKHPIIGVAKFIKKPQFSKELAELVGIILGDGCISRYQVAITLHSGDDKDYSSFILNLIKKLFGVIASIYYGKKDKVIDLVVSRIELVKFCIEKLKLKQGNKVKQQVDIPNWIKENKQYAIACARGLIDTDGSIFIHRYKVNGKIYKYKKLSFTNHSRPLLQSVFNIFKDNGLNPRLSQKRDVRLDSIKDIQQYFKIFNPHNPKYLKKYLKEDKLDL